MGSYNPISRINEQINTDECRRLLAKVDKMREILHAEKIPLPEIVVVGDQSVGKSSILEAISGIELPRAQSICTRCPLELRMKHAPPNTADYAMIRCEGVEETRIIDLSQISAYVIECTNRLTGNTVNVSTLPIFLTVYKQDIQDDLTLIDLPGITRTAIPGQTTMIHQEIISLIEKYVRPESAIVLHVIPSDVDFTTSESIQICQKYDPRYERQIIAVSKIDKHDLGIGEKLQGLGPKAISLSLGCVAVLNRKQEEIDAGVSFEEMRRQEQEFFRTNPAFVDVPKEFLGSGELVKKLVSIQQERIRSTLPLVIELVKKRIQTAQEELKRIPSAIITENHARITFNEILRTYRTAVEQRVRGDYQINIDKAGEKFNPHASEKWDDRIAFHLKMIGKYISKQIEQILSQLSLNDKGNLALKSIEENYGGGLPNFPSSNIIQQLYQPYHQQLEKPCKDLVLWVENYMNICLEYILARVLPAEVNYRDPLAREISKIIRSIIGQSKEKCMENVDQILKMEEKVFTINPYYMTIFEDLKNKEVRAKAGSADTASNAPAAHDTLIGLRAYCSIVQSRIVDQLFQLCDYWFIRHGVLLLDAKLSTAFTPTELLKIMKELPVLEHKRASLRRSIDAMERALAAAEAE